jgi:hypothetical protein
MVETSTIEIEPVAKAQAELWSKLRSTDDTLCVEAEGAGILLTLVLVVALKKNLPPELLVS